MEQRIADAKTALQEQIADHQTKIDGLRVVIDKLDELYGDSTSSTKEQSPGVARPRRGRPRKDATAEPHRRAAKASDDAGSREPEPGTQRARALEYIRAKSKQRKPVDGAAEIAKYLGTSQQNARQIIHALRTKQLVDVSGPRGEQKVWAAGSTPKSEEGDGDGEDEEPAPAASESPPEKPAAQRPVVVPPPLTPKAAPPPPAASRPPPGVSPIIQLAPPGPVHQLKRREDRFKCEPLHATITAGACVDRQAAANAGPAGKQSSAEHARRAQANTCSTCRNCDLGRQVAARLKSARVADVPSEALSA